MLITIPGRARARVPDFAVPRFARFRKRFRESERSVAFTCEVTIRDLASPWEAKGRGGNRNPKSPKRDVFVVSFAMFVPYRYGHGNLRRLGDTDN